MYFIKIQAFAVVLQGWRIGDDDARRDDAEKKKERGGNSAEIAQACEAMRGML